MRYFKVILKLLIVVSITATASEVNLKNNILSKIESGKIYSDAKVEAVKPKKQALYFKIAGIHPKKCSKAFRKISRYENFKTYLDVVKKSSYDDKNKRVNLHLSSILLPFDMTLNFVIPRIRGAGEYSFYFDKGFLKGLKGTISVQKYKKKRCLVISEAKWLGPKTKIPNLIFEFFLNALGKLTMQNLFRISAN